MAHRRLYDHDEAYARWEAGEAIPDIAASYGVTPQAIRQVVKLRQPGGRDAINAYHREYQRRAKRKPCVRGCGRLAWHAGDRRGVCMACENADRRARALAQDNHGTESRYSLGCRCDLCKAASAAARRKRRAADPEATRAYERSRRRAA